LKKLGNFANEATSARIITNDDHQIFKEIVKNTILEPLFILLHAIIVEKPKPDKFYSNKMGFGKVATP
jgi:hypothetical protein